MIIVPIPKVIKIVNTRLAFFVFISLILLFSLFARLYRLSAIPAVVSHDEVYYMVEAKTIALSGSDPTGTWRPSSLTPANSLFAELPGTLMSLAAKLFPQQPLFAGRLTSVVLGTLIPLLLAAVVFELSKNKRLFVLTFLIATVNPWIWQFSRMAFDSLFSLFFYFLGFYLLLRLSGYKKLWALLPFVLGFFQYQGLKVVFFPFILITVLAVILQNRRKVSAKQNLKPLGIFLGVITIFFGWQIFRISNQAAGSRTNDIVFSHRSDFQLLAGVQQQQSIENKLQKVFVNSYTVMGRAIAKNYLESFNLQQLFVHGEARRNPFSVWSLGIFYLIDAPLIIFALIMIGKEKKYRALAVTIGLLILIGPLPSALQTNDIWIMFRSSLLFVSLILLISYGAYEVSHLHKLISVFVLALYCLFVAQFFYEYFMRYPIYGTEGKYFAERVLGEYIKRIPKKQNITVYADEKYFVFLEILLSANLITKDSLGQIQQSLRSGQYSLANVVVDTACLPSNTNWKNTTIIKDATTTFCESGENLTNNTSVSKSAITSLLDSGAILTVYNDQLCAKFNLGNSLFVRKNVFDFSQLSDEEFCRSFFVSVNK